jgi:hypothetical protein
VNSNKTLFIALFLLFIPFLGVKEFYSRGEAREALVAQSMQLTGNYILPEAYNGAVPSKPPLLHWMINGASFVTGSLDEFTARLPSAMLALLGACVFFYFLSLRIPAQEAFLTTAIFATNVQWFRNGTSTRVDLILSVAILFALIEMYKWWERKLVGYPWLALFSLVAAALTKGPVGIALPCMVFGLFLLINRYKIHHAFWYCLQLALPAMMLSLLWYGACYIEFGQLFLDKVYYENIARLTSSMEDEPHKHSVFYLLGTLLLGLLPWIIPCSSLLTKFSFSKIFTFVKDRSLRSYFFLWLIVFIVFFSIPSSKRDTYLLPAFAPASYFVASMLLVSSKKFIRYFSSTIRVLSVGLLICSAILFLAFFPIERSHEIIQMLFEFREDHYVSLCFSILASLSILIFAQKIKNPTNPLIITSYYWIALLIPIQGIFAPAYANSISYRSVSDEIRQIVIQEKKLYSFQDEFYGVSFYLQKPFFSVSTDKEKNVDSGIVLLYERNLDEFQNKLRGDQCFDTIHRSSRAVVKEKQHLLVLKVFSCNT